MQRDLQAAARKLAPGDVAQASGDVRRSRDLPRSGGAVFEAKFMLPWSFSEEAAAEKHMPQV